MMVGRAAVDYYGPMNPQPDPEYESLAPQYILTLAFENVA